MLKKDHNLFELFKVNVNCIKELDYMATIPNNIEPVKFFIPQDIKIFLLIQKLVKMVHQLLIASYS